MNTIEHNRQLVERLVEIVNARDYEAIDDVAGGAVADGARDWIGPFARAFPDFRIELAAAVADAEHVVAYFKCSGTHQGKWQGMPPTGRRFEDVDEVYFFRVRDGRLDSVVVAVEDNLARMRQLGLDG